MKRKKQKLPTKAQMRLAAQRVYEHEGDIEIDDNAPISRDRHNEEKGAYVQAWVWIYDELARSEKE